MITKLSGTYSADVCRHSAGCNRNTTASGERRSSPTATASHHSVAAAGVSVYLYHEGLLTRNWTVAGPTVALSIGDGEMAVIEGRA